MKQRLIVMLFVVCSLAAPAAVSAEGDVSLFFQSENIVPVLCHDGSEGCFVGRKATLEVRFVPVVGVSRNTAWNLAAMAIGGSFYDAHEDVVCGKGLAVARGHRDWVIEDLKAMKVPVKKVRVIYSCRDV